MPKAVNFDITRRVPAGKSSQIAKLEYSTDAKVLRVEFRNGGTYDYTDVPNAVAATGIIIEIGTGFSIGQWLNQQIKPHYPYTKVAKELIPDLELESKPTDEYWADIHTKGAMR